MTSTEVNNRYINMKTGVTVQVLAVEDGTAKVATVTATNRLINRRTMKVSSLRDDARTPRGALRRTGYIAVHALPEDHPLAPDFDAMPDPVVEPAPVDLFAAPDVESMDEDELGDYSQGLHAQAALIEARLKVAKAELKRRNPEAKPYVFGRAYVGISSNVRFDAKLAKARLTDKEYTAICTPKPDSTLAKAILSEKRYAQICTDHGNKVEIRTATDEDRIKLSAKADIEDAKAEIDGYSLMADDPFAPA